jgi:ferredoxin
MSSRFRIVVDFDLCQGHGVCESEAPEVFAVNEEFELDIQIPEPGPEHREACERAARFCPTRAIRLEDIG